MSELQPLRADHAAAVLAFELANRTYFAGFISDRGDAYFQHFDDQFEALLADQSAGHGAYYLLVDDDSAVLGRFNLIFTEPTTATLGYRVSEATAGQGITTATVRELCPVAAERYGVQVIRASTSYANIASQRVLLNAGFIAVGPAGPDDLGGKTGTWYEWRPGG